MNTINLGKVRGNMIYTGGAVVGSSAAGVIFDATGIEKAYEGDIYINLDSSSIYNGNVYECVTPGSPDIAKWIYKGSIRGPKVSTVNNLKSTSTEDALAAYQGTRLFDMMINAGVFSKNVIVDCDQIVYGLKVVIDNVDSVLTLVVGGIEYKYNHISSGTAENTKISIVLGENIGMPQSGGVINEIRSTEAYIYAYELTDASATTIYSKNINLWDAINEALLSHEVTGTVIDGEETLFMGPIHKFVNGIKKAFYPITHAKAVWFDKANKRTVHDEISELNKNCLKVRARASISMPAWQDANKITSVDTGIDKIDGDIPIVFNRNNENVSRILFTPTSTNTRWYVSCNTAGVSGGPNAFEFVVLNFGD